MVTGGWGREGKKGGGAVKETRKKGKGKMGEKRSKTAQQGWNTQRVREKLRAGKRKTGPTLTSRLKHKGTFGRQQHRNEGQHPLPLIK